MSVSAADLTPPVAVVTTPARGVRAFTRSPTARIVRVLARLAVTAGAALLATALVAGGHVAPAAPALALAVPAAAVLAFLAGARQSRGVADGALRRLAACAAGSEKPAALRGALAEALGDPTVEIVFPAHMRRHGWLDAHGRPVVLPAPGSGRRVSEVHARGAVLAAVVHDDRVHVSPELHDTCVDIAAILLDNRRLAAEAALSLCEVRRSRARIAATADHERRRIQRDLHDGAQQRLVALRIELDIAQDLVRRDPEEGARLVCELGHKTEEALDELRALAHGVYPALLADRGLAAALRAAAAHSPKTVEVRAKCVPRYCTEVESAVYFCVLEALQNVAKHAGGARRTVVRLDDVDGELRFSVADDGVGTHDGTVEAGAGVTNMRDRLAALSGEVHVTSTVGAGTTVTGRVPTAGPPMPDAATAIATV